MLCGTITVFHESQNVTLALRGCTHFENIRRRESHFSQKMTLKNRHFHHDKRRILENECSVAPLGCSTSPTVPLLPYEVVPTSSTFADGNHAFLKKSPSKNRHLHHDKRCILENECSVAPLRCSTSPKTPLFPYEVAPTSRTFADGNHTFPKKKIALKKPTFPPC